MVAQNRGSVVLFWVPTLKEAVPPQELSARCGKHSYSCLGGWVHGSLSRGGRALCLLLSSPIPWHGLYSESSGTFLYVFCSIEINGKTTVLLCETTKRHQISMMVSHQTILGKGHLI